MAVVPGGDDMVLVIVWVNLELEDADDDGWWEIDLGSELSYGVEGVDDEGTR